MLPNSKKYENGFSMKISTTLEEGIASQWRLVWFRSGEQGTSTHQTAVRSPCLVGVTPFHCHTITLWRCHIVTLSRWHQMPQCFHWVHNHRETETNCFSLGVTSVRELVGEEREWRLTGGPGCHQSRLAVDKTLVISTASPACMILLITNVWQWPATLQCLQSKPSLQWKAGDVTSQGSHWSARLTLYGCTVPTVLGLGPL